MKLLLQRLENTQEGIHGVLKTSGQTICVTLEHAYGHGTVNATDGVIYEPKLPAGNYICVRGSHRLHSGPIETFEVENVPGHKGILFHVGNTQADSEGCILLGTVRSGDSICASKAAFHEFMQIMAGVNEFDLEVLDV
jgi:hypothetical protein